MAAAIYLHCDPNQPPHAKTRKGCVDVASSVPLRQHVLGEGEYVVTNGEDCFSAFDLLTRLEGTIIISALGQD